MKIRTLFFMCWVLLLNIINAQPKLLWESDSLFSAPESVVYDTKRDLIYVSNMSQSKNHTPISGKHSVSKVDATGKIIKYDWINVLRNPTGICLHNDRLFIVDREGILEFDLETESIIKKHLIKTDGFLNDITVDDSGNLYITASSSNVIYKIENGEIELWFQSDEIMQSNGILYDNDKLIVCVNSDYYIKSININTKEVTNIAFTGKGIIDGVKKCGDNYLVSYLEGSLYLVSENGQINELLNTRDKNINNADFEYVEEKNLLIIPAMWHHKIMAYEYIPEN